MCDALEKNEMWCDVEWRHIREIPRVTSRGVLHGSVYRIESEKDLSNAAAES